jgi:hypothetical protein
MLLDVGLTRLEPALWGGERSGRRVLDRPLDPRGCGGMGRGYATELGRAALAWAVEHQPDLPVAAFTEVHNRASRAVMERLGMRPAGIIRREGLVEGRTGVHPDAPFALYRL